MAGIINQIATGFGLLKNAGGFKLTIPSLEALPFEGDDLKVLAFSGMEAMSELFCIELHLVSRSHNLDFSQILDQQATLTLQDKTGGRSASSATNGGGGGANKSGVRYISGVIAEFEQGDTGHHFTHYRAKLMPPLHRLRYRSDCRIFQNQSVVDIMDRVLKEAGIINFEITANKAHSPREYCVQYRETDLEFIERLAAEEGFHYYFVHYQDKCQLVFSDFPGTNPFVKGDDNEDVIIPDTRPIAELSREEYGKPFKGEGLHVFPYNSKPGGYVEESFIKSFIWKQRVRPQHTAHHDYTFKQSAQAQQGQSGDSGSTYKIYDYPGRFKDWETGKQFAAYQQESHVSDEAIGFAQSDIIYPCAGHVFDLKDHRNEDFNQRYLIINVRHEGKQPNVLEEEAGLHFTEGEDGHVTSYHNEMEFCIKEGLFWRPPRKIRPKVDGPQMAHIVGPEGEEIYTDEYGRVKVQFPWDRYGKSNEHSSCWIRVSQNWAGGMWGSMAIPRIGQEVIVEFLEGDPDQPIVTGRTYHDVNRTPYRLPEHKTRMTIKSKTHKGTGFNELRFEDEKGVEEIFIKAEKDYNTYVQNNKTEAVLNSSVRQVNIDDLTRIGANSVQTVGMQKKINVGHSYVLNTGSLETHDEHQLFWKRMNNMLERPFEKFGNILGTKSTKRGLNLLDADAGVAGSYNLNVETIYQTNVGQISGEVVGQHKSVTSGGGISFHADENISLGSELIDLQAGKSIRLTIGSTLIEIDADGYISIDADVISLTGGSLSINMDDKIKLNTKEVEINGETSIKLKSAKIDLN